MKKIIPIITLTAAITLLFAVGVVSAGLCKGYDGYYHDCSSYHSYYGRMNYYSGSNGGNIGYDNSVKINIYDNSFNRDSYNNNQNYVQPRTVVRQPVIRQPRDNTQYIYLKPTSSNRVRIHSSVSDYNRNARDYSYDRPRVTIANQHREPKFFDSDPYHDLTTRTYKIRSWKYTGEEHCPDGFYCARGDWY